jgi:hypothetical protein
MTPGTFDGGDERIVAWVTAAARSVQGYYGTFPVKHLLVVITPSRGDGVGFGTTMGGGGAAISVAVGRAATPDDLKDDWVLVHEMVHTALPDLLGPHHWLEEGLATYVEPLARARAKIVTPEALWRDWIRQMHQGMPEEGDRGLDQTPTWGRTYWGGALFCLFADVAIRERTHNQRSLRDALIGVLRDGGNIATAWDIERVTRVGDAATGVPVLAETYAAMGKSGAAPDLAGLWRRLGVRLDGDRVVLDDAAPLADVRRAMTQ